MFTFDLSIRERTRMSSLPFFKWRRRSAKPTVPSTKPLSLSALLLLSIVSVAQSQQPYEYQHDVKNAAAGLRGVSAVADILPGGELQDTAEFTQRPQYPTPEDRALNAFAKQKPCKRTKKCRMWKKRKQKRKLRQCVKICKKQRAEAAAAAAAAAADTAGQTQLDIDAAAAAKVFQEQGLLNQTYKFSKQVTDNFMFEFSFPGTSPNANAGLSYSAKITCTEGVDWVAMGVPLQSDGKMLNAIAAVGFWNPPDGRYVPLQYKLTSKSGPQTLSPPIRQEYLVDKWAGPNPDGPGMMSIFTINIDLETIAASGTTSVDIRTGNITIIWAHGQASDHAPDVSPSPFKYHGPNRGRLCFNLYSGEDNACASS